MGISRAVLSYRHMAKGVLTALRETSSLSVDVSELLRHPGATKPIRVRSSVSGLSLPLSRVREGSDLDVNLRIEALVEGIRVSGRVGGEFTVECRRCLMEVAKPTDVQVDALYLYPGAAGDEDAYAIQGEGIDLEPAIRDAVVLALPLNPLCRDDCRGLCPTCGADRNERDCGHAQEHIDFRWGALERLRERMED